jgi:hypothetical protein
LPTAGIKNIFKEEFFEGYLVFFGVFIKNYVYLFIPKFFSEPQTMLCGTPGPAWM